MLILSPEERAQAWHDAASAPASERGYKRHVLASVAFQAVGSELGLHGDGYASAFRDSFDLLELSGLLERDELRAAFEEIDEQPGTARAFAAALGRHLRETSAMPGLKSTARDRAAELADRWRLAAAEGIDGVVDEDGERYATVAEVAAVYDVTPQAVYKWIHKGVIEAHTRPGGSYRIPIMALTADDHFDVSRARRLQHALARRDEGQPVVSTEEMVQELRSRRGGSSR